MGKKNNKQSPKPPVTQELAMSTGDRDVTRGFTDAFAVMPPQDAILMTKGDGDYALYENLLQDDQVASCFQQRRLALISRPWVVDPGNDDKPSKAAAAFIKSQLERIPWDTITDRMLYGIFFGFSVAECMWGREGNTVTLADLRVRHPGRFAFGVGGGLRLRTLADYAQGEEMPEKKFWVFRAGAFHDDEPYGQGLAHWLYWPVFFKRGGLRAWLKMMDKFGSPTAVGVYPANAGEMEKRKLLQALEAIQSQSGLIIPEGMRVDLLEASIHGSAGNADLYDRTNDAIAKVILSQTLTTEAKGGQYKGDVHKSVRNDVVKADADMLCESFNRGPVVWLTEWNFPGATPPRVRREIQEPEDLDARSLREERMIKAGYRPTLKQVVETYGGEWEDVSTVEAKPQTSIDSQNPAFAEAGLDADLALAQADQSVIDTLTALGMEGVRTAVEPWMENILHRLGQASNLDEILQMLDGLYPELATDDLEEAFARRFLLAEMIGRANAHANP
ncbi:MAG: DUF935 domain-containing protein [Magnetococcus sp. YQC-5]